MNSGRFYKIPYIYPPMQLKISKEIFARRLKSARKLRGLSMAELENLTQSRIKTSTLSRYERGEIMPSPDNLLVLATALQVKPAYFAKPFKITVDSIEYRKKSVLGKKRTRAIEESVLQRVERYIEVEEILGIQSDFHNPLNDIVITETEEIEDAVDTLLDAWELGFNPLPNVLNQLEELEVKVLEVEEDSKFEGLAIRINEKIPVVVVNRVFTTEKTRFNALHELGHLVLNFQGLNPTQIEKACHRFAGAMLFPRACVWKEFGKAIRTGIHINELQAVNTIYGISCQAALYRAVDLGIIPGHQIKKYYQLYFNHNREERGLSNYPQEEHTLRLEQLVTRAEASGLIDMHKASELLNIALEEYQSIGSQEEEPFDHSVSFLSSLNTYYDDDTDDYSDVPILEPNPDYEGWRYLQSGN